MWVDTGDVIVARAAWTSCVEGLVHPTFFEPNLSLVPIPSSLWGRWVGVCFIVSIS